MGVAMLGARFEAFQAQGRQPGSTHATGSSGPSGMDEFAKEVLAHQRESAATPSSFLAASLHFLIKVKSRSMWQPPVQEALLAMRQCCTSHYGEVLLKSRLDFSRCHSNLSDEYVLREGMVLPTLDSTVSIPQERPQLHRLWGTISWGKVAPTEVKVCHSMNSTAGWVQSRARQGARLLPVEALKGADLTSTSALRNLSDKGLPFKLVFRWDREGRPEEQRQTHLAKLAWAARYTKTIAHDVEALLTEVEEDLEAVASTEGQMPGHPASSLPYLKHCEARGLQEDALTPREEPGGAGRRGWCGRGEVIPRGPDLQQLRRGGPTAQPPSQTHRAEQGLGGSGAQAALGRATAGLSHRGESPGLRPHPLRGTGWIGSEEAEDSGPPSGPARKLSAKLFSLFPTPTGPVTLEMIVDRGRPSSTPSTRRTPRPAPDFRQTEEESWMDGGDKDWQRAKEAQQKRGHAPSVELTRTEQRPGLRPLSRRSRQRSQEAPSEERRKDLGPLQGDCDGDECRTDQHDEDELSSAWPAEKLPDRTAPLLARRPPTPATGGSPTFGRGAVAKDPDLLAMMQWSTAYGIPAAIAISAGWSLFVKHVQLHRALHYWWVPDATFIDMLPEQLIFARHSPNEWLEGDKKTGGQGSYVSKMVSKNLQWKAGRVREFVSSINFELPEVQSLLLEVQQSGSSYNVSCKWMRENRARWSAWKPVETNCYEGFGLFDAAGSLEENSFGKST
eukprot:g10795.t1